LSAKEVKELLATLSDWKLTADGQRIRREWKVKDFLAGLDFFQPHRPAREEEGHHPDLHLARLSQRCRRSLDARIGGLSENDFIWPPD